MMRCLDEKLGQLQDMTPYFVKVTERIATPDWEMTEAAPDTHSLIFIYDGWMILDVNGREYTASRGDLVYLRPGEPRRIRAAKHSPFHCYEVDFLYACIEWEDFRWSVTEPPLPLAAVTHIDDPCLLSRLLELFSDLIKEWQSTRPNRINYCRALFTDIVISVLITQVELQVNYDKIRKVERIINYLIDHYDEAISLKELADLNGISIPYTNKIFKEVTGTTPFDYLANLRINKAKELLNDGHSVSSTAVNVGYADPAYFSRRFKQKEGISPLHYQMMHRRAQGN